MPIYEYYCRSCGHRFDALQKAGEGALRKCPACARLQLEKCLSTPSFQLRGAGWRKPAASERRRTVTRKGHRLDSGPAHSHDDDRGAGHGGTHDRGGHTHAAGDHGHSHGNHTHSHGGRAHSHGSGHKHDHKH